MADQNQTPTIETSEADAMLVGYLKQYVGIHGREALERAAKEVLGEDTAFDYDEPLDLYEIPSPMEIYDVIENAKPDQPLTEIHLGDRHEEKIAHLKYRGIRTTTDLVEAQREEIPANTPNQVELALKLFIARFVPLILVTFDQEIGTDAGIHRRLAQLNCTTAWDVTQTPAVKLRGSFNAYELQKIITTFKEKFGVGLKSPTPELTPAARLGGPRLGM